MASLFAAVELAPRDPILGLTEQFNADPNPAKVNLGVGVYYDDDGKLPLLKCVAEAEKQMVETPKPRGYLPIDGIAAYDRAVQGLAFGADSAPVMAGRDRRGQRPRPRAFPRHGVPGLRRRHRRGPRRGRPVPGLRHGFLRLDQLLQELLAVRRAGRRPERGLRIEGRGRSCPQPAQ